MSLPIDYHPSHACMLERGWVFAFAHVRGGGERGKAWHAAGRGPNKWNSFWDFQVLCSWGVGCGLIAVCGARKKEVATDALVSLLCQEERSCMSGCCGLPLPALRVRIKLFKLVGRASLQF